MTIFLSVPAGYFVVGYVSMSHELNFKSRLTAERMAKYVYRYRQLWQYQAPRLAELIETDPQDDKNFAQEVRDTSDKLVIRVGPDVKAPRLIRSHPIVVAGHDGGPRRRHKLLWPLWEGTALVALLSALLGFAAYFAVRVFPLRVLDRTLGELRGAQRLAAQNERLDAALTNMSQGLLHVRCRREARHLQSALCRDLRAAGGIDQAGHDDARLMALASSRQGRGSSTPRARLLCREFYPSRQMAGRDRAPDRRPQHLDFTPARCRAAASSRRSRTSPNGCSPRRKSSTWPITMRSPTCRTAWRSMSEWKRSWAT